MTYSYEQLRPSDVDVLKELLAVFGEAFQEVSTYQDAVPSDDYLRRLLARPHFIVMVARWGDAVVGGLAAYDLEKFEQERSEIYVYDLAVAQDHRRRGVATALLEELRGLARRRGAHVIYIQADRDDEPAVRLYESLGRREEVLHFDIPVEEPSRR